ncbi:MAG: metal-dependent transcriptional regulator [Firmicutes bacterium]|nr:metal-dependent transcriptional regulator [Bacillota bacterium]
MNRKSNFYTLNGYKIKNKVLITESMEDYLEMIYRNKNKDKIHIKEIAQKLNVKPSSASKMINKLKEYHLVNFEKYGLITLTEEGESVGKYLLWRHNILVKFFKFLNKKNYSLEQVEKIEHFIDYQTLKNMEKFIFKNY